MIKEAKRTLLGNFNDEIILKINHESSSEIRQKIYSFGKSQNINQLDWDVNRVKGITEYKLLIWLESRRFEIIINELSGDFTIKKNSEFKVWGVYHLIGIFILFNKIELFDNNYIAACLFYLIVFLIIYLPIRKKENEIWIKAIGIIEGSTGLK